MVVVKKSDVRVFVRGLNTLRKIGSSISAKKKKGVIVGMRTWVKSHRVAGHHVVGHRVKGHWMRVKRHRK